VKSEGPVLVDGKQTRRLHPLDRGLQYGDGVFRTMRARPGRIDWWADQYAKLASDAQALGLACPPEDLLRTECLEVSQDVDCVIKLILTRGTGSRGFARPVDARPTRIVQAFALPDYPAAYSTEGIKVRWCSLKLGHQPRLAGIKHLNRLENVIARAEWSDPGIAEGLLMDETGWVVGGVMSNILVIRGKTLFTPDLSQCGIAGVARMRIMRACLRTGMTVCVTQMRPHDIYNADEVCLCNSLMGVWRIRMIEDISCGSNGWAGKLRTCLNEND
jgi:4-amino-4-deoxychorismate lyase